MFRSADTDCDFVVVGSGAGGGTVAARLAEYGAQVVLVEAGGDPRAAAPGLPDDYDVPAFHPFASENPAIAWDFFVRHYTDDERQRKCGADGVFYPRAGTLGGCTAHNAMILVCPDDADWDGIAALTNDASWRASCMRRYFQRLESCRHRPGWRFLSRLGLDWTGHGWHGWLPTERAMPSQAFADDDLLRLVLDTAVRSVRGSHFLARLLRLFETEADPNDMRVLRRGRDGVCYTPLSTADHHRFGARERVLDVAGRYPDRLRLELDALAVRVMLNTENRAVGIEYLKGTRLYRAHSEPSAQPGTRREIHARRGVILAGGAFNTPQLLLLSGIGPAAALGRYGIPVRVDLPGVGQNLQDRYEVGVVNRMARPWKVLCGARFEHGDPLYKEWADGKRGMYISNGAAIAVARRSSRLHHLPDLFCMALLARFHGYFPGYSREIAAHHDYLTWAVLKAHTVNRAGTVRLRSADPRDMPLVNFHYFDEGSDGAEDDLRAVIAGIRFVRSMTEPLQKQGLIAEEELPGPALCSDAELAEYVRDHAWGHHASCSCPIGAPAAGGVLDSRFAVHGTRGLWVADASVFPRIPGFFIASAVYMVGEKAADVIRDDAGVAQ